MEPPASGAKRGNSVRRFIIMAAGLGLAVVAFDRAEAFSFQSQGGRGLCVAVQDNRLRPGSQLVLDGCNVEDESQSFSIDEQMSDIGVFGADDVLLCVHARDQEALRLVDCRQPHQRWRHRRDGMVVSPDGLCWDVPESRFQVGTPLIAYRCHGGPNQRFRSED